MFIQLNIHIFWKEMLLHAPIKWQYLSQNITYIVYKFYSRTINKKLQKLKCQHI